MEADFTMPLSKARKKLIQAVSVYRYGATCPITEEDKNDAFSAICVMSRFVEDERHDHPLCETCKYYNGYCENVASPCEGQFVDKYFYCACHSSFKIEYDGYEKGEEDV